MTTVVLSTGCGKYSVYLLLLFATLHCQMDRAQSKHQPNSGTRTGVACYTHTTNYVSNESYHKKLQSIPALSIFPFSSLLQLILITRERAWIMASPSSATLDNSYSHIYNSFLISLVTIIIFCASLLSLYYYYNITNKFYQPFTQC